MLQAGFARVDVTPPLGNPLAGYFSRREADGVLDPIELNALAVSDGENTVVIISCDFLYVMENAATPIRKLVSEKTELPENNILIHGLHQHTSVRIGNRMNGSVPDSVTDASYLDFLYRKYCDVTKMAMDDMADSSLWTGQKETADPISFIRRFRMKDGSVKTNPGRFNPDVAGPIGEADNTVRLVRFKREGKKDIALVNFSTHPDVIGGTKFSADWPGFARRLAEADIPDANCLLINGPQGDTNHIDINNQMDSSPEGRYAHSRFMGRTIADAVVAIWDKLEEKKAGLVSGDVRMLFIPTNTTGMDRIEEMKQLKKDMEAGIVEKLDMGTRASINRILDLKNESLFQRLPVTVIGFGEIALVGYGGEAFTFYAKAARDAAPDLFVLGLCLANGGQGYLPTKEAFDEGGYEASNSRFAPELAEMIQTAVKEMLAEYQAKKNEMA